MPEEQKKVKITAPRAATPGGSFMSREKVLGDIQEQKIRELETAQTNAKEAKATEDEQKRLDAINKLLPEHVASSIGEVPYDFFKAQFQTVWDQVAEKTHLSSGYCTYDWEVAPGVSVTIRTLKSGEMKFLRRFTPITDPSEDPAQYMDEDSLFRNVRFVIALMSFDSYELPALSIPKSRRLTKEMIDEWMQDAQVNDRFDWVDDLPEELGDKISGVFVDLSLAYRFALQENLKNQFAPPSPM